MKKSLTFDTDSKYNFSQKIHLLRHQRNKDKIKEAILKLENPFDPSQISQALKCLENQFQRRALLDQIILIRKEKLKMQELEKINQMKDLLTKVSRKLSLIKNQQTKYTRDQDDFKILQEERNKFDKFQYENLNFQINEDKHQLRRLASLSFLTKETDKWKINPQQQIVQQNLFVRRKTQRNASLIVNAVQKKQIYLQSEQNTTNSLIIQNNSLQFQD
ncbi:unnamed protein product [Paramecium primaurelia]|uniref:Uncharacterized protein n=1 Tax=Paramecium primaurelia TaxID=5886 RepID=A0A8S1LTK9_PARPR|nr:unnamed protein product [Paramecium primaurelia]CAD8068963.1 unnamed protein product [Paramecium primaurelia]